VTRLAPREVSAPGPAPSAPLDAAVASERTILFLVGAVQFVNILDFMMVMPLGPDFAAALGIPISSIGLVGGAYTASAAVSGLAGAFILDRFDRRIALAVALAGLTVGTAMGGLALGLPTLLAARVLAGFFGGPATSLALAVVSDVVPPERRGQAMGKVMGAFSVASVLGVPAGLEIARLGGWRAPFFAVAALGAVISVSAVWLLPPLRGHLARAQPVTFAALRGVLGRPIVRWSYAVTAAVMTGGFILIPNFSAYIQNNLAYPRDRLWILYLVGGAFSFVGLRLLGGLADRFGSVVVAWATTLPLAALTWFWFAAYDPRVPILVCFTVFMILNSGRNVAYNTLTSKVPRADERARFMSMQSAVQHMSGAVGAMGSSLLLTELPGGRLGGVERMTVVAIVCFGIAPILMGQVAKRLDGAGA
jgi:predicted MFS family arabinose efflux permease